MFCAREVGLDDAGELFERERLGVAAGDSVVTKRDKKISTEKQNRQVQQKSWAVTAAGVLHAPRHHQDIKKATGEKVERSESVVWSRHCRFAGREAERIVGRGVK
jgi:hypothetical protein